MAKLTSFTCFPKLPIEIRLMVWEHYALPRAPILYRSPQIKSRYTRIARPVSSGSVAEKLIHVNREARRVVLGHRECFIFQVKIQIETINPFRTTTKTINPKDIRFRTANEFLFVNWEKDAFYISIQDVRQRPRHLAANGRIQNLVLGISPSDLFHYVYGRPIRSWGLRTFFDLILHNKEESLRKVFFYLESVRNLVLLMKQGDLEGFYHCEVPNAVPFMKAYSDYYLRSPEYTKDLEFGFIPIPTQHDIKMAFEDNPEGFAIVEKWHRETLVVATNKLIGDIKSILARHGITHVDVRLALGTGYQGF